ncbi:hypothetical protein E2562_004353 [Oryza meyeriana var. granulata]|uniref:Uncharacterized protein n=1 Tax=Oryza meyeriana var. granulata TaxID=110450 RepID=A0A6G1BSC8_9ORYZ|nr:hypothetical protein E2562_004353 [Oryza meyeriana var. granulata]
MASYAVPASAVPPRAPIPTSPNRPTCDDVDGASQPSRMGLTLAGGVRNTAACVRGSVSTAPRGSLATAHGGDSHTAS